MKLCVTEWIERGKRTVDGADDIADPQQSGLCQFLPSSPTDLVQAPCPTPWSLQTSRERAP